MTVRGGWRRLAGLIGRLRRANSGVAMVEFALATPIVVLIGGYGIELCNMAIVHMRVSQIALNLADNASRVGLTSNLTTTQLRESDINDVLIGAKLQGASMGLTQYGRITLSSLENVKQSYETAAVQRIHWQRCIGLMKGTGYDSSYGTTSATAGTAAATSASSAYAGTAASTGMGDTGYKVMASDDTGVMFVEVNYQYQGIFGTWFTNAPTIHYIASFVVRDKRDFSQIFNPTPAATRSTCDLYAS